MAAPSRADVQAQALRLANDLLDKREKGGTSPEALAAAAMVPDFSKGTSAIDEDTGQPVVGAEVLPVPGGDAGGTVEAHAAPPAEETPAPKERDAKGRYVSEAAADMSPEPVAPEPAPAPEVKAEAAAEAAAEEVLAAPDPFADFEEIEYEDPDLDKKFKVYAPKDAAAIVKRGYSRQADYTRKTMTLAAVRKELQPLIEDGRINQILPLIRRALNDPEYGTFVAEAFQRREQGLPLTQAQAHVVASAAPAAAQPVVTLSEEEDPFFSQYLKPYNDKLNEVTGLVKTLAQQEEERNQRIAAENMERTRRINVMVAAHQELARQFPDEFTGDIQKDNERFQRAAQYARESGYAQAYPDNPLAVAYAWGQFRAERAAAASSPAAEAIAQRDVVQAQERRVAAANAAAVSSGAPATQEPKKKVVPPAPPTRVNGRAVGVKEYANAQMARIRAQQQS